MSRQRPAHRAVKLNRRQRKEAKDLSSFIDARGGRLCAFRSYSVAVPPKPGESGMAEKTTPTSGSGPEARDPEAAH